MSTTSYRSFHNSCAIEMGLSDFHKMIVTVMKTHFQKNEPKIVQYKNYNNSSAEEYHQYILRLVSSRDLTRSRFDTFITKCKDAFNIRAPIKRKYLRSNQSPFMDQARLRNKFLRTRSNGNKENL